MACEPTVVAVCRQGSLLSVALDALTGDPADVSSIEAGMKPCKIDEDGEPMFPRGAITIPLTAESRAASGNDPAGWTISMQGTGTADLDPGYYAIDAKLTYTGGVLVTGKSAIIEIEEGGI